MSYLYGAPESIDLKYGLNPYQGEARIYRADGELLPLKLHQGRLGYINLMDALNGWQLVRELEAATGRVAAASFKHVSPAGAAVASPLDEIDRQVYFVDGIEPSPLASAYIRARGADRLSSFGDFVALSEICDEETARYLRREVSDGVIAPGYTPEAMEVLGRKKKGSYIVLEIDPDYEPESRVEKREIFGLTLQQERNDQPIDASILQNIVTEKTSLPDEAKTDLLVALITLKYTQSNSVCYAKNGQTIGVGAGQQSRVHCTRLAGGKADLWSLRRHPKVLNLPFKQGLKRPDRDNAIDLFLSEYSDDVLRDGAWQLVFTERPEPLTAEEREDWLNQQTGISLGSDAFFPFRDNLDRAAKSGVSYVAQPGGSVRDDLVIEAANEYGMTMVMTDHRLFHH